MQKGLQAGSQNTEGTSLFIWKSCGLTKGNVFEGEKQNTAHRPASLPTYLPKVQPRTSILSLLACFN